MKVMNIRRVLSSCVKVGVSGTIKIASNSTLSALSFLVWGDTHQTRTAQHHGPPHELSYLPLHLRNPPPPRQFLPQAPRDASACARVVRAHFRRSQSEIDDDHDYRVHDTDAHDGESYLIQIDDVPSYAYNLHFHSNPSDHCLLS